MDRRTFLQLASGTAIALGTGVAGMRGALAQGKDIVYLTPGLDLPFWRYLSKGVEAAAKKGGYGFQALDSHNSAQTQLQNAQDSIARGVAGIVISPTDSSTAPSVLQLAKRANIPVVIADIGTNSGDYESFIISDNYRGAHDVGTALAAALKKKGWENGSVGIVAISQARKNGQARTKGFLDGLKEGGFTGKDAGMQQMQSYTADETFKFVQDMLTANPDMRGLFVQTDQPAIGALRAIKAARRNGEVMVAAFDGIPDFVELLKSGDLVVSGMQQPYLMGVRSGEAMIDALSGKKPEKEITVPILAVTSENIEQELPTVKETVFANEL
ncbi:substrate-binding domain-containing protein [Kaistia geumhonensis]|uniref:ABC-type sugar transport system substrate-binding protein n=1 Tax=Kaistia geumhonensis TaxID=410839 RepID=A0ABU0M135_9HYPH|nr:substrate-binding domain-containing protein [Kaistia geumhonensis]MCX5480198.1 substrate-binding domain-containing protein [Kaistia geumhonensis]MDQ0514573.1 ABC-type sugar transport system substrate-binding protein [Kaistia geumhonensis]